VSVSAATVHDVPPELQHAHRAPFFEPPPVHSEMTLFGLLLWSQMSPTLIPTEPHMQSLLAFPFPEANEQVV
jgi:hypothetical protein